MRREPRDIFHVRFLEAPNVVKSHKKANVDFQGGVLVGISIGLLAAVLLSMLALLARNV